MTLVRMHAATKVGLVPSMIGDKPPIDEASRGQSSVRGGSDGQTEKTTAEMDGGHRYSSLGLRIILFHIVASRIRPS